MVSAKDLLQLHRSRTEGSTLGQRQDVLHLATTFKMFYFIKIMMHSLPLTKAKIMFVYLKIE